MKRFVAIALAATGFIASGQELKDKITVLMPLENSLEVLKNDGSAGSEAVFKRLSEASQPDFKMVSADAPRFVGGGILIENGNNREPIRGTKNYLSSQLASLDSVEGLSVEGKSETVPGLEGKGALRLTGKLKIELKYPHAGGFIFSFYLKNGEVTVMENDKVLKTFKSEADWQRCHVLLNAGKEPGETVIFLNSEKGAELDAMMLEGDHAMYLKRSTPSSWLPGGALRAADSLSIPFPAELAEAGAISLRYTSTGLGTWNCLINTHGWKPELSIDVRSSGRNITAKAWGKDIINKKTSLETGKEYSFILSWNAEKAELYLDGKLIGETPLPPLAERKAPKFIGIGGSLDITSPNIRAEGIIRDFALWKSGLSAEEAAKVAELPKVRSLLADSSLINLVPVQAFGREAGAVALAWNVKKK